MTDGVRLRLNRPELERRMQQLMGLALGKQVIETALTRVGLRARVKHVENFRAGGGKFGDGKWKPITWITALLRKGGKFETWDEIHDRARKSRPLADTGDLERSVLGSGRGAVLKVDGMKVHVGTNLKYGDIHQEGGRQRFTITAEIMRRLNRAISQTTGRGRPGGGSEARKKWNPFFFEVLGALRKRDGEMLVIPQRQFIMRPGDITSADIDEYEAIITATLAERTVQV